MKLQYESKTSTNKTQQRLIGIVFSRLRIEPRRRLEPTNRPPFSGVQINAAVAIWKFPKMVSFLSNRTAITCNRWSCENAAVVLRDTFRVSDANHAIWIHFENISNFFSDSRSAMTTVLRSRYDTSVGVRRSVNCSSDIRRPPALARIAGTACAWACHLGRAEHVP